MIHGNPKNWEEISLSTSLNLQNYRRSLKSLPGKWSLLHFKFIKSVFMITEYFFSYCKMFKFVNKNNFRESSILCINKSINFVYTLTTKQHKPIKLDLKIRFQLIKIMKFQKHSKTRSNLSFNKSFVWKIWNLLKLKTYT